MNAAISNSIQRAKITAKANGIIVEGSDIIQYAEERPSASLRTNTTISDGDVFTIPPFPVKERPKDTDKQWIGKKLSRDTAERVAPVIISCFCEVENSRTGAKSVKELFVTQFTKATYDVKKEEWVVSHGSATDAVVSAVGNQIDSWNAVGGKKVKFSNPTKVDAIRTDYNGRQPDRAFKDTIWQIDFA